MATRKRGVEVERAPEARVADGPGAEGLGGGGEAETGLLPSEAELLASGDRLRGGEAVKDLAGDVALQAANDVAVGLALGTPASGVGLRPLVAREAHHDDAPQGWPDRGRQDTMGHVLEAGAPRLRYHSRRPTPGRRDPLIKPPETPTC